MRFESCDVAGYVLASLDSYPSIWSFYDSQEHAEKDMKRVNEMNKNREYKPMTYVEYLIAEKNYYMTPLKEIDAAKFDDMLNCLPPLDWTTTGDFESFCMSEFTCGNITAQFARCKDRYFTRNVDATNKETFITRNECLSFMLR